MIQIQDGRFCPVGKLVKEAHVSGAKQREEIYAESVADPHGFWRRIADEYISWHTISGDDRITSGDFSTGDVRWFEDRTLNACYNCVDRHVEEGRGNDTAFIWVGNDPTELEDPHTYKDLQNQVCRAANALRNYGVHKGDRVILYMQVIPNLPIMMLACARIGAIHSVVYGGLAAEALRSRINDCGAKLVVTQNIGFHGSKRVSMKQVVNDALVDAPTVKHVIVVCRDLEEIDTTPMDAERDVWWHAATGVSDYVEPEWVEAEHPLFILYTSGSTGKPKGMVHTTGGYLTYAAFTFETVFDYQPGELHWCTADIGWITGHTYSVYGPLAIGAKVLLFEGTPSYPDHGRFWQIIQDCGVNIFYTAPTALRALRAQGDEWPNRYNLSSLRLLGTVGEPIKSPEWMWYHEVIGGGRCPIVDTWWQTETGGIMITPLPYATPTKPGSATLPFFGIQPVLLDEQGNELQGGDVEGNLAIRFPWPGIARTIWGDHDRFVATYFRRFPGYYNTGDGCRRDTDGYYWITGRVDDTIIVSGHNFGTAEIEGAIGAHFGVAEAAIVDVPDAITGSAIYAFVICKAGINLVDLDADMIRAEVRNRVGPIAKIAYIQFVSGLPKTRSGKIMRRILRGIARGQTDGFGDLSTLADPTVVEQIIARRIQIKT